MWSLGSGFSGTRISLSCLAEVNLSPWEKTHQIHILSILQIKQETQKEAGDQVTEQKATWFGQEHIIWI